MPSNNFKNFIKKIAKEFGINEKNIFSYFNYYKMLVEKDKAKKYKDLVEEDELNFSSEYLSRVYSKELIRECYVYTIEHFDNLINKLIDQCDVKLSSLIEEEKISITQVTDSLKQECVDKINKSLELAKSSLGISLLSDFSKIKECEKLGLIV